MEEKELKILIIDDDNIIQLALANALVKRGYVVLQASNGREGLNLYQQYKEKIDVILSDINMPELDGMELLEEIRKNGDDIPVIIMTGESDLQLSVKALKLGAFDFILKPFELPVIFSVFSKLESILASKQSLMKEILLTVTGEIEFSISSQTKLISGSVSFVHDMLLPFWKLHKIDPHKVSLCLHEALSNAIIHGNLGISSLLKEKSLEQYENLVKERELNPLFSEKEVRMRYQWSGEKLVFEVEDEGAGFDYRRLPDLNDPVSLLSSGRGLLLVRSFMDEVNWSSKGDRIQMVKYVDRYQRNH